MANKLGTVILGGGTGFIGSNIRHFLVRTGYKVVTVSRKPGPERLTWDDVAFRELPDCAAVINVAGQNILDPKKRWTPEFQETVRKSRVNTTVALANAIERAKNGPKVFVTISGVGYYKASPTAEYTEDSPGGDFDFFSRLTAEWEAAAKLPPVSSVRQVVIRSGVALGRDGGMVQQLIWPFYLGLGGPVAPGTQFLPWIHVSDLARLFVHAVRDDGVHGVLNGVAPHVVTNAEFARCFARHLWRPALVPMYATGLIFGRERAKMMTEGQRVLPKRTLATGFEFWYPDIDSACKECAKLIYADDMIDRPI